MSDLAEPKRRYADITGQKFGRLTAVRFVDYVHPYKARWLFVCDCGAEKVIRLANVKSRVTNSCGCLLSASRIDPTSKTLHTGYVRIYVEGEGRKFEHRVVMERIIGRSLESHESVHHKNGDRTDNRPKNLELWSSFQPSGQRVVDKISFAKEILELYKDFPVAA